MTGSVPEVHAAASAFEIGDLLKQGGDSVAAIVLDKSDDDGRLLVMRWPSGEVSVVTPAEITGWTRAPGPVARWVEVYELDAPSPFFAATVPDIHAAIAIYRAFEAREGDFKVEIYTNDEGENAMLDEIGYFE